MLQITDFTSNGYSISELSPSLYLLEKKVKDMKGNKYCIKVFIEDGRIEPEVWYKSKPLSTVNLQIDSKTTLQEIEDFFEEIWVCAGRNYDEF